MATMHFHIAQTGLFLEHSFTIQGVRENSLSPTKIVLGCKVGHIRSRVIHINHLSRNNVKGFVINNDFGITLPGGKFYFRLTGTSLSTYDFSTLYTTSPHNLIKEKLLDLIERTFYKKGR